MSAIYYSWQPKSTFLSQYYFGVSMYDGGRARENVGSYNRMYYPYGLETVEIGGTWYALPCFKLIFLAVCSLDCDENYLYLSCCCRYGFVTAYSDDTVNVVNVSGIKPGASFELYNELPLVSTFYSGTDSAVGSNLNGPWGIKHAHISGTDYLFVACYDSDGTELSIQ